PRRSTMILDKLTEFADADTMQAATTAGATFGNQIDLVSPAGPGGVDWGLDVGNGQPVYFVVTIETSIVAAGSGTLAFQLVSADDAALSTDAVVHFQSRAFTTATGTGSEAALKAGSVPVMVALPVEGVRYRRYLGVKAVIGSQALTAGAVNAFL